MDAMVVNIVIVGAGFAGLAAAAPLGALARARADLAVHLFDRHAFTTMIPALPDLAGGRCGPEHLTADVAALLAPGVSFHAEGVTAIDFAARRVTTRRATYTYDYLIVAAGAVTDFFGFDQHLEAVHTLDFLEDANGIRESFATYLRRCGEPTAIVVGAGYTGLELACNLQFAGRACATRPRVCIVERADRILPAMPDWVREYMRAQAARHGIEPITGASVEQFDGRNVTLSNGRRIADVFVCWTTGTRFPIATLAGRHEQVRDGRLKVDPYLRLPGHPEVFVAGSAAAVEHRGAVLRKAVNFARGAGTRAGRNVVRAIRGLPLKPFRPVDLGWVIPFCDVGVGEVFSRYRVRGRLPLALHYAMCGLRHYSIANRLFFWKTAAGRLPRPQCARREPAPRK